MTESNEIEVLRRVLRNLIRILATVHAEKAALTEVLAKHGILPVEEYQTARDQKLQDVEPSIRQIDEASDSKLLELLLKFEGPVQ